MGNTIILTKKHPSELGTIDQAEAFQISLLGDAAGPQRLQEEHGWWDEKNQKAQWLSKTLALEKELPFEEARKE